LRRRTVARILAILLGLLLVFGVFHTPVARADVNLPPVPPGVDVKGWDELGLIANLYQTWVGQYSSKASYGEKWSESATAAAMYGLGKLIAKMPGPVQWAFFAKDMGAFGGYAVNYTLLQKGFNEYKALREGYLTREGYVKNGVLDVKAVQDAIINVPGEAEYLDAFLWGGGGNLDDAIAYVLYGDTSKSFNVGSAEFVKALASLEMAYLGEKWREKHLSSWQRMLDSLKNFVFGSPLPTDYNPYQNCPRNPATRVNAAWDPNDIEVDPAGLGEDRWVRGDRPLRVTIHFENMKEATAAAEDVRIVMPLDPALDPASLRAEGSSYPVARMVYDERSGSVQWFLPGINLPPNVNPPEGEGWVAFTIGFKPGVLSGTAVRAWADIFFDYNPPVRTPEVVRTVAGLPKVLDVKASAAGDGTVTVSWAASADAGIFYYELYRGTGGGSMEPWLTTVGERFTFKGTPGATYTFAVRAVDRLEQESALSAPVSITVPVYAPTPGGRGGGYAPPAGRVEKRIIPTAVTVAELSGRARVEVPAGAVKGANARLVLEEVDASRAANAGMAVIGPVVDITLLDGELTGRITVSLYFDRSKLPENCDPAIFYYDEKEKAWRKVGGTYDLAQGTITAEVDHLTLFTAFAVPKELPKPVTFTDISGHWAEKVILELAGKGLLAGYPDGTFRPENPITRAEVTALLVRVLKPAPVTRQDLLALSQKMADAQDIPSWVQEAAAVAVREGLVKGDPADGRIVFAADRQVTRLEVALLLVRALARKGASLTPGQLDGFGDADAVPPWARDDIALAVGAGLLRGYPDGTLRPEKPVTRAEAAAMLSRWLALVKQ